MHKSSPLNRSLTVSVIICLIGFSSLLSAKMYKWVDADGTTHYTQSPPPDGIEGDTIKPPPSVDVKAAQNELEKQQKRADSYLEQREKSAEEKAKQEADLARDNKNCEISRSNVASLERPRINLEDDKGNVYRAPEEERLARLKKAQEDVAKFCK